MVQLCSSFVCLTCIRTRNSHRTALFSTSVWSLTVCLHRRIGNNNGCEFVVCFLACSPPHDEVADIVVETCWWHPQVNHFPSSMLSVYMAYLGQISESVIVAKLHSLCVKSRTPKNIMEETNHSFPKRMRCVFLHAKWTRSKSTDLMVQQQGNNTTSLVKLPKLATFCIYMGMVSQQGMHHCFVFTLAMYYIFDISLKEICTRQ